MAKKFYKSGWFKWLAGGLLLILFSFFGLYLSVYAGFWGKLSTEKELLELNQLQASLLYDENEQLIGKYYITDREAIHYEDLPQVLIDALVATEDVRFFEHKGIDQRSLMRVFFKTLLGRDRSSGGGSTLTLQLAKNLNGRKTYPVLSMPVNKLKESFVARRLEAVYSKEELLTLYLNTVPFSGDTYGVESAAQKFFSLKTRDLNLSQAATLVGTLKANHSYDPRLFPERSQLRRDIVLQQMVKYGFISKEKADEVAKKELEINYKTYSSGKGLAPYFRHQVRKEAESILADKKFRKKDGSKYDILRDGLKIYTTLDATMQEYAEAAVKQHMTYLQKQFEASFGTSSPWSENSKILQNSLTKLPVYKRLSAKGMQVDQIMDSLRVPKKTELFTWEGNEVKEVSVIDSLRHYMKFLNTGMVSMDPKTGAVRAYVGGVDYQHFQYDHVLQSKRQVGSIFKPILYAAALENGMQACDYFSAKEVTYVDHDNWTPKNAGEELDPELNFSMTAALAQSLNTVPVKILQDIGVPALSTQARKMGIEEPIGNSPSVALGTSSLKLIDMAVAYTSFLNSNGPVKPFMIKKITDKDGNLIMEAESDNAVNPAFSENTRQTMLEMLKQVVDSGTAQRLRNAYGLPNALAGKTGTTQRNADGWFVGLMPDLVSVVWVGNDNPAIRFNSTALGQGANSALPIFAELLQTLNKDENYNSLTNAGFDPTPAEVLKAMDCEPTQKDGFLKRIFKKEKTDKHFDENKKEQKKKGFFKRLFGGKKK